MGTASYPRLSPIKLIVLHFDWLIGHRAVLIADFHRSDETAELTLRAIAVKNMNTNQTVHVTQQELQQIEDATFLMSDLDLSLNLEGLEQRELDDWVEQFTLRFNALPPAGQAFEILQVLQPADGLTAPAGEQSSAPLPQARPAVITDPVARARGWHHRPGKSRHIGTGTGCARVPGPTRARHRAQ